MMALEIDEVEGPGVDVVSPLCTSDVPMSVHLDYCSKQLRKFDMMESDDEEENMLPEMQCLAKEISVVLGSTKRSLLDNLEKEVGQKKRFNSGKVATSGPLLNNKPNTRGHGGVKNVDKANA
ncbi:hypothetical protein D1007_60986 [Hordeum vulgare]|nr:hypothetical protein D1007_60986 [Hordeum vulgare]